MIVIAIIVTFKPNIELLLQTVNSLNKQLDRIIIVNNDENDFEFQNTPNLEIINLKMNYGIAYAQNRGIERALSLNADFVLLSDQDTVYPSNFICNVKPFIYNNNADVYCPVFYDNVKKTYAPIMVKKFKSITDIDKPTYVEHAIASGTLIDTNCLKKVGLMDESLFIDYVDFEWCWRAVYNGMRILTIPTNVIIHNLGDGVRKIFNKEVTLRSDFRYYYILRNGFYLAFHCKYLSFIEKVQLFKRTLTFSLGVLLLRHNLKILKVINRAFIRGAFSKLIQYDI